MKKITQTVEYVYDEVGRVIKETTTTTETEVAEAPPVPYVPAYPFPYPYVTFTSPDVPRIITADKTCE
jgi:hypothetical protein